MASKPSSSSRSRALGCTSSPEYLTIRECYPHLVSVVKDSYDTIGDRLFSQGYISRKIRNFIRMDSKMPTEKAQKLLDTIIDRIVYHPNVFDDFIEILEKEGPSTSDVVRELRDVYKTKGVCEVEPSPDQNDCDSEASHSMDSFCEDSFHFTTEQPESTHRQPGCVCLCGECSSEQFFSEKGCPKAEQKKLFPFLDVDKLDDADKIDLEQRLISDTRKMVTMFANLLLFLKNLYKHRKFHWKRWQVECSVFKHLLKILARSSLKKKMRKQFNKPSLFPRYLWFFIHTYLSLIMRSWSILSNIMALLMIT